MYVCVSGGGSGRENDSGSEVRGSGGGGGRSGGRSARRDDPRRHTLAGDQHYQLGMQAQQGGTLSRTMDLEVMLPPYANQRFIYFVLNFHTQVKENSLRLHHSLFKNLLKLC